ncbi:MAG: hypothetical protein ACR2JD_00115, partial [Nocardioides sp.]
MSETNPNFTLARRGYEPAEVDRTLHGLRDQLAQAHETMRQLEEAVLEVRSGPETVETPAAPASYSHLGERIGQLLTLAEKEATQLREEARADSEGAHKQSEQAAVEVRAAAEAYAEQHLRDVQVEATRIVDDAHRLASEERDAAERDAAARRQEAEAVYEQQRAKAAAAAADFESTLAERRNRTTAEFQEQQAATHAQLETVRSQLDQQRAQGARELENAKAEAARILQDATG